MSVLVDSNVLLDVIGRDEKWYEWSATRVAEILDSEELNINPVIYAEISIAFENETALEKAVPSLHYRRLPLPYEAAFLAGKAFVTYRHRGGQRQAPMPDFYIGAHAVVSGMTLLTRDVARYRTYFPKLKLIAPEQ